MPIEIDYLIASIVLFIVMIVVQALSSISSQSLGMLVGPRDDMADKTIFAGRARRANANMMEGLIMFAPLVLAAAYTDRFNDMTALGAALFFWGRLAFAPSYWLGLPWIRTLVWAVSVAGIVLILLQVIPFSKGLS